ncbi:Oxidoreductase, molybdopterin-binding domain containing protein [Burkholderiaceae bacterium]
MISRFWLFIGVCLSGVMSLPAWAQSGPLAAPTGKVVLTVTGNISKHNANKQALFDLKMIEALPQHSFTTRTPWYSTPVKFTGPKLADVLAAVGAQGKDIQAVAINNYQITIPISDAERFPVVMAWKINDQPIPVRAKGPLFIAFPYDDDAALRTAQYYERSIWQLKQINIQ